MASSAVKRDVAAHRIDQFPPPREAEIVFAGRSNVGKSTLINQLTGVRRAGAGLRPARVSQTPGCTQAIYFYPYQSRAWLVDLPGYGYARWPAGVRQRLSQLLDGYFRAARPIVLLVHLVDARWPLQPSDWRLLSWLEHFHYPYLLTLNKCDKLSRSLLLKRQQEIQRDLRGRGIDAKVTALSALRGQGLAEFRSHLRQAVDGFSRPPDGPESGG